VFVNRMDLAPASAYLRAGTQGDPVSSVATDPTLLAPPFPPALAVGLGLVAAAAVAYAGGDVLLPVLGLAAVAVAALKAVGFAIRGVLELAGHRWAQRTALFTEGALAVTLALAGWATGAVPSAGDGALIAMVVASLASLVPRALRPID
jgi:hypothetical protein